MVTVRLAPAPPAESHRRVQAEGRGAVRPAEPQVDQVDAQAVLPVLLRPLVPGAEPGLPVRGRRQPGRPEAGSERGAEDQGRYQLPAEGGDGVAIPQLSRNDGRHLLIFYSLSRD